MKYEIKHISLNRLTNKSTRIMFQKEFTKVEKTRLEVTIPGSYPDGQSIKIPTSRGSRLCWGE